MVGSKRKNRHNEILLQHAIVDFLHYKGVMAWVNYQPMLRRGQYKLWHHSSKGVSDISAIGSQGRHVAIEVKLKGNKPTQHQEDFLRRVEKCGGSSFVAYSIEDVAKFFDLKM